MLQLEPAVEPFPRMTHFSDGFFFHSLAIVVSWWHLQFVQVEFRLGLSLSLLVIDRKVP